MDVFYCPTDPNVSAASIMPAGNQLLPTGLKFGVPHGYMLQVCNRSSMGAKRSLVVGAHIIDSGYDGEVFIDLHNIGVEEQFVAAGDKIAQLILVPVVHFRTTQVKEGLYDEPITMSGRGAGSLGSTDKKSTSYTSAADLDIRDKFPKKKLHLEKYKATIKNWEPNGF
jgi:dUTP pyrophosphatase